MSWSRQSVAQALAAMIQAATANAVYVHETPPEIVNPTSVVIMRATVTYATGALGVDEVELPIAIVGGIESDDTVDATLNTVRQAVQGDPTLKGTVPHAWPVREQPGRNLTGAGGIQLMYVELVISILM